MCEKSFESFLVMGQLKFFKQDPVQQAYRHAMVVAAYINAHTQFRNCFHSRRLCKVCQHSSVGLVYLPSHIKTTDRHHPVGPIG